MKKLKIIQIIFVAQITSEEVPKKWLKQVYQPPIPLSKMTFPYCFSLRYATNRPSWVATICIHGLFPLLNYELLEFHNSSTGCYLKQKGQPETRERGKKLLFIWPCWTQEILTFSWETYMERFQDYKDSENCLNLQKLYQRNLNLWHVTINDTCQLSWGHEINSNLNHLLPKLLFPLKADMVSYEVTGPITPAAINMAIKGD